MEEKKNKVTQWLKAHKNELIVLGIGAASIALLAIGLNNEEIIDKLNEYLESLEKTYPDEQQTLNDESFCDSFIETSYREETSVVRCSTTCEVCSHIRNLQEGRHASASKIATAADNGFDLEPGQTWVESYTKGDVAA